MLGGGKAGAVTGSPSVLSWTRDPHSIPLRDFYFTEELGGDPIFGPVSLRPSIEES